MVTMGVWGLNTWMRKKYVGAYVPQSNEFDHVYLDMASVLHQVIRRSAQQGRAAHLFLCAQPPEFDNLGLALFISLCCW